MTIKSYMMVFVKLVCSAADHTLACRCDILDIARYFEIIKFFLLEFNFYEEYKNLQYDIPGYAIANKNSG